MTTTLQAINASASPEVQMNENAASLSPSAAFGKKPTTTAGLTFGYYGGTLWVDGVLTEIAVGTVALTDATTNYIERTRAGVVSKNVVGFTAGQFPLFTAVTSGGLITVLTDQRITNAPFTGQLSKSVAGAANVTLTAAEARNNIITFTGVLTGNIAVIVPTAVGLYVVNNQTTGAFTLTVKTAAGTGVVAPQSGQMVVYCDGTNVLAATGALPSVLSKSVAGSANVTLTAAEARSSILTFTGVLTGNISVIVPTVVGLFVVNNQTTGVFTLTVKTAAGTGIVAPQGGQCLLYCDGTNILTATGLLTSTAAIGYATGAGGAVAQATSRTTGVTLSKLSGTITTDTTSLAALGAATFTVTNTLVAIGDVVLVSQRSGATNVKTEVRVTAVAAGSFNITVHNIDAATAEVGAIIINFAVIKAVSA